MKRADHTIEELRARYPSLSGLSAQQLTGDLARDAQAFEVASGSPLF